MWQLVGFPVIDGLARANAMADRKTELPANIRKR
jgi:hypothetical protein